MGVNTNTRTLGVNNFEGVTYAKNYLKSTFDTTGSLVQGWSLFNTTLTSGLPTGTISNGASSLSLGLTTTNPLTGFASLQLIAPSVATAGQGFISDVFTLERADQAKVLTALCQYEVTAGAANANFSGILGSQSFAFYLYDVSNSIWVQPGGFLGITQSSGPGTSAPITFQTNAVGAGNQYRLAFICLQATSSAIIMNFDNFQLSRITAPVGAVITDWVAYTPTIANFGSVSGVSFASRRMGDSLEIQGYFTQGTGAGSTGTVSLGYSGGNGNVIIDVSKPSGGVGQVVGNASASATASTTYFGLQSVIVSSSSLLAFGAQTSGQTALAQLNGNSFNSGASISFNAIIPISGWSSNLSLSNDTDTRVIAARASVTSAASTAGAVPINYNNVEYDTAGAVTTGAGVWKFTAPVSGYYRVSPFGYFGAVSGAFIIYKNGSFSSGLIAATASVNTGGGSATVKLNTGDFVDIRSNGTVTPTDPGSGLSANNYVTIERLSGPAVIAATESVNASYMNSTGTSIGTSATSVPFATKEFDSHNAFGGTSYTAPISGKYEVNVLLTTAAVSLSSAQAFFCDLYKNGSFYKTLGWSGGAGGSNNFRAIGSATASCNAGDTLSIFATSSIATTLLAASGFNYIEIERIGN